jgi:general secretion pathway protein H
MAGMASPAGQVKMLTLGTDWRPRRAGQAGFTLLEMLAVVALLAIVATLATVRLGSSGTSAKALATLISASDILRHTRSLALRSGREQVVQVDVGRRSIIGTGRPALNVLPELGFSAVAEASEQHDDGKLGIRFFPDGSSTGGALIFAAQGRYYKLHVNWFTGNVATSN